MTVFLFIGALDVGGCQAQFSLLARSLAKRGIQVHFFTLYAGGRFWEELERYPSVQLHALIENKSSNRLRNGLRYLSVLSKFRRAITVHRPAVVYSALYLTNLFAALAMPRRVGTKLIWGVRSAHVSPIAMSKIPFLLGRFFAGRPALTIANSRRGLERHRTWGYIRGPAMVIPNGIDTEQYLPSAEKRSALRHELGIDADEQLIGIVCRFDPVKNIPLFLQAAARLNAVHKTARFLVVGNGSTVMRDSLEAEATRLGIGPRLLWLQSPADMVALYSALDVLVSSSDSEGFSNVLTEAMACGVPCVATDVGDSAWILGDTGRIVPPQQTDALAEGIRDILATDPATRGKRARQRIIDNFSIEKMVDATLEAFA